MTNRIFKIVYMGTPAFAVPTLEKIILQSPHEVKGIVTQPDRKQGRGLKMKPPPVKEIGEKYGISVYQPKKIGSKVTKEWLAEAEADLFVVMAYGKILPKSVLSIPSLACINVHASLLPFYRGAAPINWSIVNGENETGITTMFMDEGMDTGDILMQNKCEITLEDTAETLHDRLSVMGADLMIETLDQLAGGELKKISQDNSKATYAPLLKKEQGQITWNQSALQIFNLVRGFFPWPGAFTFFKEKRIKILKCCLCNEETAPTETIIPGSLLKADAEKGILVATGADSLWIHTLQPESKSKMHAYNFYNGYSCCKNDAFSNVTLI